MRLEYRLQLGANDSRPQRLSLLGMVWNMYCRLLQVSRMWKRGSLTPGEVMQSTQYCQQYFQQYCQQQAMMTGAVKDCRPGDGLPGSSKGGPGPRRRWASYAARGSAAGR